MSTSARIFINYRRSDSAGWAHQLHGDLGARFGSERVFRDVAIAAGVDFVEHVEHVMDVCEVCIVVIGPRWLDAATADGHRRLDDPRDLVRLEIQHALARADVTVIPVLVDGARMPGEHELPDGLRPLARRNARELTDSRWDYDMEVLCRGLRSVLGESTVDRERVPVSASHAGQEGSAGPAVGVLLAALATLAAAACAGLAAALASDPMKHVGEPTWGRLAAYAIERGVIWAIVGAVVAAVVAVAFGGMRIPLGPAFVGAGAGWLAGAVGGAGYMTMKYFGHITEQDAHWLLLLVSLALPGVALARVLAREAGASAGECALAALAGAVLASWIGDGDRTVLLTAHVLLVVGPCVAVLAASQHGARIARRAPVANRTAST